MHPLKISGALRMLPPGGAPLPFMAIARAFADSCKGVAATEALQAIMANKFGQKHLFCLSSGRGALALLFMALRRIQPEKDQILLPAYLSFSVPSAVVRAGCRVALYDVLPETLTPDLESVKAALSGRTLAVVAAHQFGLPFDLAPMAALCRENGAFLVDDAAQVMGATIQGQMAGTFGDAGIFSLSRGKPICAVEGGILCTNDDTLAAAIEALMANTLQQASLGRLAAKAVALSLCRRPEIYRIPASLPWLRLGASIFEPHFGLGQFTDFQASLAIQSFENIESINARRVEKASLYRQELAPPGQPIAEQEGTTPIYLRFPVIPDPTLFGYGASPSENRPSLHAILAKIPARSLGISPGFPLALCDIPELGPHLATKTHCPGARFLAQNCITLPTHDQVSASDALGAVALVNTALAHMQAAAPVRTSGEAQ